MSRPPDEHGFCSLGTSVDAALAAARSARTVIAQVNPLVPRTLGDSFIHASEIDMAVEVDQPPYEHIDPPIGDVERQIGEYVAELVPDGATLQMGIGSIPAAVGWRCATSATWGAHRALHRCGPRPRGVRSADRGAAKEINRGKIVTAFLMGSRRLYDFVDDNPMVEMRPVDYTNDTSVIRRFQAHGGHQLGHLDRPHRPGVADSIGTRFYSGVGGQMDFMRGAALAPGGPRHHRSAIHRAGGTVSRICAVLPEGAGVVTSRAHVRTVVTEYGVAELFGRSVRERAHALIAIAHPDFRDELRQLALRRFHLDA